MKENKKKIAVVTHKFCCTGGIEIALINFLKNLNFEKYDVTLFTYDRESLDEYIGEISDKIKIEYTFPKNGKDILLQDLKKIRLLRIFKGIYARVRLKFESNEINRHYYMYLCQPPSKEKYDIAIAYHCIHNTIPYMRAAIRAKIKTVFCHASTLGDNLEDPGFYKNISKLDKMFCVSNHVKSLMDAKRSKISGKTEVVYNLIPAETIKSKSFEPMDVVFDDSYINLLTLGRIRYLKGQNMIPKAARLLLDAGYNIRWYLVGDGDLREKVESEIEKYGVNENVILLGEKSNPYPYIKNCDIYVQTSYSEGYCTSTVEAKILGKPIVTTDAPGMREQFVSGENGFIVDAMTSEAIFDGIKILIDSPKLCEKFMDNLSKEIYDNTKELEKIYRLIED